MKEKKYPTCVMLVGGLTAAICCIIKGVSLVNTLIIVFASLIVFLMIGLLSGKFINSVNNEVKKKEQEEADRIKREEREAKEAELQREYEEEQRKLQEAEENEAREAEEFISAAQSYMEKEDEL